MNEKLGPSVAIQVQHESLVLVNVVRIFGHHPGILGQFLFQPLGERLARENLALVLHGSRPFHGEKSLRLR